VTPHAWGTLAIVVGAIVLFASEKVRIDIVALGVLVLLVVFGMVTPVEALSGFSNEATVTVAAMFALSLGIERYGALEPLGRLLSRIRQPWLLTLALMLAIAPMGAFIKNIALVATFLPLALRVCARTHTSPGRVLMPMAFAAQMGGVCTLIGTSSNLLADSLATQHGLPPFGVFEFTRLGAILAVVGIAYLMLVGRWLLPKEITTTLPMEAELGKYVTELKVNASSPLIGQTIADASLGDKYGVYPLELLRGERHLWSPRSQKLAPGDVQLVRGDWEKIEDLRKVADLELDPEDRYGPDHGRARVLVEVMVKPDSGIEGYTLDELAFRHEHVAITLAIHRRGRILREKLKNVRIAGGYVLHKIDCVENHDTQLSYTRCVFLIES
jgi:di/tricarboxylate transporter